MGASLRTQVPVGLWKSCTTLAHILWHVCFCQTAAVGQPSLNATISYPILRELVLQAGDGSSHMRCRSEPQANLASRDVEMSSFVFQIVFAQVPRCFRQVTCPYPKARLVKSTSSVNSSSQHNTLFGRLKRLEAHSAPFTTHRLDLNMGRPYINAIAAWFSFGRYLSQLCQVESPLLLEVVVCFHGLNGSRMLFQDSGEQCHAIYNWWIPSVL